MKIIGVIPARYASTRFPGKPLISINGKKMIERVYEQCLKAKSLTHTIVATDDISIFNTIKDIGGNVMMTSENHINGTSRCAEVAKHFSDFDYVINIQGDEPYIHPTQIDELALLFNNKDVQIATQVNKITDLSLLENTNIVKAILDEKNYATDFKRSIQQSSYKKDYFYKHIGIYGFKLNVLNEIVHLAPTDNELKHHLEQLRWLDNNYKMMAGITRFESMSIDTKEDVEKVLKYLDYSIE